MTFRDRHSKKKEKERRAKQIRLITFRIGGKGKGDWVSLLQVW